jgi:DNA-binding response OmpR family regulator
MPGEHLLVIDDSPTVLKVIETTLTKAGYFVDTAPGGVEGLSQARDTGGTTPALILLDCGIPNLDGVAFCRQLAEDRRTARVPVVLMAPKGEDLEERFARATNVVDYITKPFSPEALQAVVSHVVGGRGGAPSVAPSPTPSPPAGFSAPSQLARAAVSDALSQSVQASTVARETRWELLRRAISERLADYQRASGAKDLASLVNGALDDRTWELLLPAYGQGTVTDTDTLSGELGPLSVSEVLLILQEQGQTGCLRAQRPGARVEIFFRNGQIDFAGAVGVAEEFLLGRFAVAAGDITVETLNLVLADRARAPGTPRLFGAELVTRGLLSETQLRQAMTRQTSELVYEVLRWTTGRFGFQRMIELPELARSAGLAIAVDAMLLEGFRRIDEWRIIQREIDSFDLVFVRNEAKVADMARGKLTRDEIAVLEAVNSRNAVRDIIRELRMGSFDVSKILFRLLRTRLIRRRVAPIAT